MSRSIVILMCAACTLTTTAQAGTPRAKNRCPAIAVTASAPTTTRQGPDAGAQMVTFEAKPASDIALYNWTVSAGAMIDGQGTPSIIVQLPPSGEQVTAQVQVSDDPACGTKTRTGSLAIKPPR